MKKVEKKRHLAKTITWRIIASADTFLIAWLITGKFDWAGTRYRGDNKNVFILFP